MRVSEASPQSVFQRTPCLQWCIVFAVPMMFFLINRLAALPALLDQLTHREEDRTASNKAKGVFLGMLEDFILTVLLVVSLVMVDVAALLSSRMLVWSGADEHFHTSMILRGVGNAVRFGAVLTLVIVTFTPFSLDMASVRSHKRRQFSDSVNEQLEPRDSLHGRAISDDNVGDLLIATVVSIVFSIVFVGRINLAYWWPTHEHEQASFERESKLSFSTPTYMDIRFEPYKLTDTDVESGKAITSDDDHRSLNSRHTTIVSAPCELYGDDEATLSTPTRAATCHARLLGRWPRIILLNAAAFGVFLLLIDITHAASQLASPLVAGIALNSSLDRFMHGLFQTRFSPTNA